MLDALIESSHPATLQILHLPISYCMYQQLLFLLPFLLSYALHTGTCTLSPAGCKHLYTLIHSQLFLSGYQQLTSAKCWGMHTKSVSHIYTPPALPSTNVYKEYIISYHIIIIQVHHVQSHTRANCPMQHYTMNQNKTSRMIRLSQGDIYMQGL